MQTGHCWVWWPHVSPLPDLSPALVAAAPCPPPTPTGYRHWHADLRSDDSPLEAGLAFTCKLKASTPFLGREALEKQRAAGLRRRLVCFTVDE